MLAPAAARLPAARCGKVVTAAQAAAQDLAFLSLAHPCTASPAPGAVVCPLQQFPTRWHHLISRHRIHWRPREASGAECLRREEPHVPWPAPPLHGADRGTLRAGPRPRCAPYWICSHCLGSGGEQPHASATITALEKPNCEHRNIFPMFPPAPFPALEHCPLHTRSRCFSSQGC